MVVIRHHIEGYDNFVELVEHLKDKINNTYVMFSGSKDSSGFSWCPDCVKAEPVMEEVLKKCSDVVYIYVGVGVREATHLPSGNYQGLPATEHISTIQNPWRDPENKFRTDKKLRLTCVPTLMKWSTGDRLNDQECQNKGLVELLFEDHLSS